MSLNEDFIKSIDNGESLETIRSLLQRGASVDYLNNHALLMAVIELNIKLIELLLDFGADVNYDEGLALVMFVNSANRDTLEQVRFLLSRGAKATVRGNFPLYIAVQYDWMDMVRLLLENGAKPERAELGTYAMNRENYEMMNLLIKHGYDINYNKGILLRHYLYRSHEAVIYLIYNGIKPDYLFIKVGHNKIVMGKSQRLRLFIFNTYMSSLPLKDETTWDFWIAWAPYLGERYVVVAEEMKKIKSQIFSQN
jgi:hypothetical protein